MEQAERVRIRGGDQRGVSRVKMTRCVEGEVGGAGEVGAVEEDVADDAAVIDVAGGGAADGGVGAVE